MDEKKRCLPLRVWFTVLRFFKLVNHKDELSLTNIAFWIFLYKIAVADMSAMSANELAAALSVVGLYFGTKVLNRNAEQKSVLAKASTIVDTVSDAVDAIKEYKSKSEEETTDDEENGDC